MLLRSGKSRHTSDEVGADKFCDTEFQDRRSGDLVRVLSVYRIDPPQLVQCHTEHYAAVGLDPNGRPDWDLEGLVVDVASTPHANWPFHMTCQAHCDVQFESDEQVRQMAALLFNERAERTHEVTKEHMRVHVRAAVAAEDPEWMGFLARPGVDKWRRIAGL